jgi:hypothetical protein
MVYDDNEEETAAQEKEEVIEEDNAEETDLGQDQDEMPQLSMETIDGEEEENFLRQRAPTQEPTATGDEEEEMEEVEENFLLQRAPTQEPTATGDQEGEEEEEESASQQMQMAQSAAQEPRMNRDGYLLCDRGETITDKCK